MKRKDVFFFALFAIFLLTSIHGVVLVPVWHWKGLDLYNFYVFHTQCPEWPVPYLRAGLECGDPLGRPLVYPPLMYWLMSWVRGFDFYRARLIWSMAIVTMTIAGTLFVAAKEPKKDRSAIGIWILWGLLFFQLPMAYAIERGNHDAALLPVYGGAIALFVNRRLFVAGILMAVACWMKVYPVIPVFILLGACLADRDLRRKYFRPLFAGVALGGGALAILLLPDSYRYVFEVLPKFAAERGGINPNSHILYKSVWAWIFIKLPILFLWGRMTVRHLERDPALVLSGGLAISTFFQNTSNDYNFVTAYPFLFLALLRFLRPGMRNRDFAWLILTFLVFVGDRTLWIPLFGNRGVLYWQILWLFAFPLMCIDKRAQPEGNLSVR